MTPGSTKQGPDLPHLSTVPIPSPFQRPYPPGLLPRRDTEINFEAMRFLIPTNRTGTVHARGIMGRDLSSPCQGIRRSLPSMPGRSPSHPAAKGRSCDLIRLPRINPAHQGKPYCFAYGMQTGFEGEQPVPRTLAASIPTRSSPRGAFREPRGGQGGPLPPACHPDPRHARPCT